ncbi:MAG: cadmium-translocating P-type ATPase [Deltaproteobacteria bacterium]|nr:cadmium-translocating P-type ATPase [Deltaproteobacteria bacterium]HCH64751.1 cadmium-translocating P-type ATPase [Deltaproteobacteria bacterium]
MSASPSTSWQLVLTAAERRSIGLRLAGDLTGGGLLLVGVILSIWRPDQPRISAVVSAVAALVVGIPVLMRGLPALLSPQPRHTTDQLVSLALLAAWAQGAFVTATLVPLILDIGRLFEERTSLGAREAIAGLHKLEVREAVVVSSAGVESSILIDQLSVGDRIRVRPGQVIPVDGLVIHGHSAVDQAPITGESRPEDVEPGTAVYAGTLNVSGLLELRITGLASDSVLGRVASMLRRVADSQPQWVRSLERLGAAYVPVVLTVAATTLFFTESVERAITVLVVAVPTALVVAGPAAMVAALSLATRRDMLIKDAGFLEVATSLDTLVIDKTGTLTTGELVVSSISLADGLSRARVLQVAATCGHGSLHPVSRAAVAAAEAAGVQRAGFDRVEEVPGLGARASVGTEVWRFGRPGWLRSEGVSIPEHAEGTGVAVDGRWLGGILLEDTIRPGAQRALDRLRAHGLDRVVLLTGDRRAEAERVGAVLQVDEVFAEVLPEDKLRVVEQEQSGGRRVLMVGDGVNDALALSRADMGVSLGANVSEVALGGADVALLTGEPERIPELLDLARRSRTTVHQNLGLALAIVVVMMTLAIRGGISPLWGALAHDLGALLVVLNAARMLRHQTQDENTPTGGSGSGERVSA